jgi:hypothetical protein
MVVAIWFGLGYYAGCPVRLRSVELRQHPTREEIAKVLGEPVGFDISETAAKLRRNLMLVSMLVMVLIVGEISAGSDFSIFGVKLVGVTPSKLMVGLSIVLAYTLLHFLWYCYELYSEWSIRITGTKLAFVTGAKLGATGADYPDNPRQSTLYSWWLQEARSMKAYEDLLSRVDESIRRFDSHTEQLQRIDMTAAGTVSQSIQGMKNTLEQVRSSLASTENTITNTRIPESLERFDNRFRLLLNSQNMRSAFVEIGVPVVLSLGAATCLIWFFLKH